MANNDASQYTLRYNEITGNFEFANGVNWVPISISAPAPESNTVQATFADTTSSTSADYETTITLASFTASSDTSVIRITVQGAMQGRPDVTHITVMQDGVLNLADELTPVDSFFNGASSGAISVPVTFSFLFTPGDTDEHTYTVYIHSNGSATIQWGCNGSTPSLINIEEIH